MLPRPGGPPQARRSVGKFIKFGSRSVFAVAGGSLNFFPLSPPRDRAAARFCDSDGLPFAALAEREGVSSSYFTRLVRLSYLAPDITQAILDGASRAA